MEASTKRLKRMKIIYSGDSDILDWLVDNGQRNILPDIDDFLKDGKGKPGLLLHNCPPDLVIVILYDSPFAFTEPDNHLIMYADNDLDGLIDYFRNLYEHTSGNTHSKINKALEDILAYLWLQRNKRMQNDAYVNFMG